MGAEKGAHIYFAPVSIEGKAPAAVYQDALSEFHELLEAKVINVIPSGGAAAKKAMKKAFKAASRLMAWNYHGCPDCIKDAAVERLMSEDKLDVLDLHVLGLALSERNHLLYFMDRLRRELPEIKSANNWLRAFRNLVRLNENALRDVDDEAVYDIVKDVLLRLEDSIDQKRKGIAANCLEALLYVLKRRRYSNVFMAKDGFYAFELIRIVNGGYSVNEGGVGYSESTLAFLSSSNRSFVGALLRFLNQDATDDDIHIATPSDESDEEDEE